MCISFPPTLTMMHLCTTQFTYWTPLNGHEDKHTEDRMSIPGQELEQTKNFVYLGGNISTQEGSDKDMERRIGLAKGTWQALGNVWNSKELSKATKHAGIRGSLLVLSTLLYTTLRHGQ